MANKNLPFNFDEAIEHIKPGRPPHGKDGFKKALSQTDLVERFTEHDLRAKVASDLETDQQAQRQLDHSTVSMTRKAYRRKAIC